MAELEQVTMACTIGTQLIVFVDLGFDVADIVEFDVTADVPALIELDGMFAENNIRNRC